MYALICTRPYIVQAIGVIIRFMSNLSKEHWTFFRRVLRYFQGTYDYFLVYHSANDVDKSLDIQGFVDANWIGDLDSGKSTSGSMFTLFGGAVSWMSKI